MRYKNVLFLLFCIVAIIVLIISIKQDLDMEKEWKEQLEKGKLYIGGRLCCGESSGSTIITDDFNQINVTINLSELDLSGIGG